MGVKLLYSVLPKGTATALIDKKGVKAHIQSRRGRINPVMFRKETDKQRHEVENMLVGGRAGGASQHVAIAVLTSSWQSSPSCGFNEACGRIYDIFKSACAEKYSGHWKYMNRH